MKHERLKHTLLTVAALLLIPLVAMQFTDEVNWSIADFIVAGALLLGSGLLFDLIIRKIKRMRYRIAISVILVIALLVVWAELAVGIF
jgi:asparagine N-glycosylation enzyme membrane subunit Stt3